MLVWIHWFFAATCLVQLVYRPGWGGGRLCRVYAAVPRPGRVHWLPALPAGVGKGRSPGAGSSRNPRWTRRWYRRPPAAGGGFAHFFIHLLYYPVLAGFAVFVTSFRLNLAFVTAVAVRLLETEPTAPGGGTYLTPAAICRNPI